MLNYLNEVERIAREFKKQNAEMQKLISLLKLARKKGSQVFICGNGGSAGTATHLACDLFKLANIKAISLTDNTPLITAIINDNGWGNLFTDQLKLLYQPNDMLIAISVHGGSGEDKAGKWSQNLNKAVDYVSSKGGSTIGLTGFDGGYLKKKCTVCLVVPAESTPLVEAFHVVLHHYIAFELQEGNRI